MIFRHTPIREMDPIRTNRHWKLLIRLFKQFVETTSMRQTSSVYLNEIKMISRNLTKATVISLKKIFVNAYHLLESVSNQGHFFKDL